MVTLRENRKKRQTGNYHIFWQERQGGYYLIFYPLDAFSIIYNMDVDKAIIFNVSGGQMLLELSHDIKTPVATIKSFACALEEGMVLGEELSRYYHTIALKAERVYTLSEDLFTMLKMESADYQPKLKPLNLAEFIRSICGEYYGRIAETDLILKLKFPRSLLMF